MYAPSAPASGPPVLPSYSEHHQHQQIPTPGYPLTPGPIVNQPQPYAGYPQPHGAPQPQVPLGGLPTQGYPPAQGYPPVQGYPPPQGYPPSQGYPPTQGYPPYPQPIVGQTPFKPAAPAMPAQGYGQPVTNQPQSNEWMPNPSGPPNFPPGLEYLTMIDQLLVHQKVELLEAFTGFETSNKYSIKNSMGQKIYAATEQSDCCSRNCFGPLREFNMKIVDNSGHEVISLNRPLACQSCFFPCCMQVMEVSSPPGTVIGSIHQEWSLFEPRFSVKDASGETVLTVKGPLCTFSICGDVEFNIYSKDGSTKVGKISKQWSGFVRESFTDSDMFGINFPLDLDVKMKAVMLGTCFLIDFMFFEKAGNKEHDRPGMF